MKRICVRLCQEVGVQATRVACAVGVLGALACGETEQHGSGQPAATTPQGASGGSAAAQSPANGGNDTSGTVTIGGGGASIGGTSIGGAPIGGASIGGASIGGGDQGSENPAPRGDCKVWPADCSPVCEQKIAGCLVDAANQLPAASTAFDAEVTEAQAVSFLPATYPCAHLGQFFTDATRVSIKDSTGKSWALVLPVEMIGAASFATSAKLQVDYKFDQFGPYRNRQLVVSDESGVLLFVLDAANKELTFPGLDLKVQNGNLACPPSVPDSSGCSRYTFHTLAKTDQESVDDPCGKSVGGFIVSSLSEGSGMAPPNCGGVTGFCDGDGQLLASGVRAP